jgi:hypothetical protein
MLLESQNAFVKSKQDLKLVFLFEMLPIAHLKSN